MVSAQTPTHRRQGFSSDDISMCARNGKSGASLSSVATSSHNVTHSLSVMPSHAPDSRAAMQSACSRRVPKDFCRPIGGLHLLCFMMLYAASTRRRTPFRQVLRSACRAAGGRSPNVADKLGPDGNACHPATKRSRRVTHNRLTRGPSHIENHTVFRSAARSLLPAPCAPRRPHILRADYRGESGRAFGYSNDGQTSPPRRRPAV